MKLLATFLSLTCLTVFCDVSVGQDDDFGVDLSAMNRSVRAQDDLYQFVNGTWLKNTEIPSDKSNFGSFTILADRAQEHVRDLIEEVAENDHQRGTNEQKVGDFYKSFMDVELVESLGYEPIEEHLGKIRAIKTKGELLKLWAHQQRMGIGCPIGFFISQDDKDSTRYAGHLIQSGTSMPAREYYLSYDRKYVDAREAFQTLITTLLTYVENEYAEDAAAVVLSIETELAGHQWPNTRLRNPANRYNKFSVADWQNECQSIDWAQYLKDCGVEIDEVIVMTPSFFADFDSMFQNVSLDDWKLYTEFGFVDSVAPLLSKKFVDASFDFHTKQIAGVPEQLPRWKKAVNAAAGAGAGDFGVLGEVVGELYVQRHFKPKAKAEMEKLVNNLLKAFDSSIDELAWMTDETKVRAKEKLAKITPKIGYPNKWRDYSGLKIEKDDLVGNMQRSAMVEYNRMIEKLGQPIDREEWGMTPHTVNAYYNPSKNEIVFPAAILQAPFFSESADAAINYGGIGAVIGHEISHAFDDSGSQYDGDGNLKNWWTDADRKAFQELTKRLVAQYEKYEPLPDQNVNGRLTLGENIADLSGLAIAFKAYQLSLDGKPAKLIAGWNGKQRFFLGWSQVWRRKYRDAEMVRRLVIDPHSPSEYRANGPVTNIDAFYEAFEVKEGDKLFKPADERIRIW